MFASCQQEPALQPESVVHSETSVLSQRTSGTERIDPFLTTTKSEARDAYLAGLTEGQYTSTDFEEFVYDVEYYANVDSWTGVPYDRHHLTFKEYGYPAPDVMDANAMEDIRTSIAADVQSTLQGIGLPSTHKWLDIINVSGSNDGSTIYALVGIGGNLDPCPGDPACDLEFDELADDYDLTTGTNNSCVLPSDLEFGYTERLSCGGNGELGALDYAANFTNRAGYVNGVWSPINCNPVDPGIFYGAPTAPNSNVVRISTSSLDREYTNLDPYDASLCHAYFGIFDVDINRTSCSGTVPFCVPQTEAYPVMQGGIAFALSELQAGSWGGVPPNSDFYCTVDYYADFVTSPSTTRYFGFLDLLWVR